MEHVGFAARYASDEFSQNGEDGIIAECLRRMTIARGYTIEIGANDGRWCSNTARLLDLGFLGTMVEADHELYERCEETWRGNSNVIVVNLEVSERNINVLVGRDVEVFSTDTDGRDFEIWQALQAKPRIVVIEIDSSIPPNEHRFNDEGGAGYWPMLELARRKGYFLLCHTGNMIFLREADRYLFPEVVGDGLSNSEEFFNRSWLAI